ncbi:MAG: ABC transporter substrate-binding protein [Myxococcales bacterium]|nr:ABC transporter substrate-binding protein [Myxococcales bacterium]
MATAAACTPRTHRTPDDTLVVLIESPPRTSDPRVTVSSMDQKLSRLVCPGLVVMDAPDSEPRLGLAERIEQIDALTWEATVRADVRFSDGTPVTADDVAWTYESTIAGGSKTMGERFVSFERRDDRRVRFHLRLPLATFMTDVDLGVAARHGADAKDKFPGGIALCAGPYRVDALGNDRVRLSRNPYFAGPAPAVPKIDIRVVRDAAARIVMLAGGSADLVQNAIRPDLIDDVLARPRLAELRGPSTVLSYLMFNTRDPLLADVRVRRALALALDRPTIVARKFAGRAVLATGLLPPDHWAYRAPAQPLVRDLAEAGRLLDAAGYPDPDGPGGAPRLALVYKTSSDQFRVAIARVIAAQLAELDVEVEVRPFEFGTFFADVKKGSYQLASMQTAEITEPDMYYPYFHSSRIPDVGHPDDTNRWRYVNPEVDRLLEAGRQEGDRARRVELYAQAQALLSRDLPIVPLWHEDNVAIVNRAVTGYHVLPNARWSAFAEVVKQ